jgi:hypothetical protein
VNPRRRRHARRRRRERRERALYTEALAQLAAAGCFDPADDDTSEADDDHELWCITFA